MRTTLLCTLVAATSLFSACATSEPAIDELAGETAADGEEGKGDSAAAFTYYMVTIDPRACSIGSRCGGFFVARANRTTTVCGDGSAKELCYVDSINWAGTGMPASVAKAYEDRLRNEESFLFRGSVKAATSSTGVAGAALAATEIWTPISSGGTFDGVFTLVKGGNNCNRPGHPPCVNIRESRLNSTRSAEIREVDFSDSGADPALIKRAQDVLDDGSETLIVVGDRYTTPSGAKGRTANQFFARAPVPLHGNPGSCVPGAAC